MSTTHPTYDSLMAEGDQALQSDRLEEAATLFTQARHSARNGNEIVASEQMRGIVARKLGRHAQALDFFGRAFELRSDKITIGRLHRDRGMVYLDMIIETSDPTTQEKLFEKAEADFDTSYSTLLDSNQLVEAGATYSFMGRLSWLQGFPMNAEYQIKTGAKMARPNPVYEFNALSWLAFRTTVPKMLPMLPRLGWLMIKTPANRARLRELMRRLRGKLAQRLAKK